MNIVTEAPSYKRFSASTTSVLVSGPCALLGVFVASVLTGQIVQLWDGSDATLAAGTIAVGTCTLAANTFTPLPMTMTSGLVLQVLNDSVDLTLFYTPMGNNT